MKTKVQFRYTPRGVFPTVFVDGRRDAAYGIFPSRCMLGFAEILLRKGEVSRDSISRIVDNDSPALAEANALVELKLEELRAALLELVKCQAPESELEVLRPSFEVLLEVSYCQPGE